LIVPDNWTLDQLHLGLQATFGWAIHLLHKFLNGGLRYGDTATLRDRDFDDDAKVFDPSKVRLPDFQGNSVAFDYLYDFGDGWLDWVRLEDPILLKAAPALFLRHCQCTGSLGSAHALPVAKR